MCPAVQAGCSGSRDGPGGFQRLGMAATWRRGRDKVPKEAAPPSRGAILHGRARLDSSLNGSRTLIRSEEELHLSQGHWNRCIPHCLSGGDRQGQRGPARTGSSVPRSLVRRPNSGMASVPWGLRARLSAEHRPLPKKPRPCLKGLGACGLSSPHLTSVWVSLNLSPPLALSPKGPGPGQRFLNEPGSGVQTRQGPDFQCSPDAQSSVATRVASEAPLLFTP